MVYWLSRHEGSTEVPGSRLGRADRARARGVSKRVTGNIVAGVGECGVRRPDADATGHTVRAPLGVRVTLLPCYPFLDETDEPRGGAQPADLLAFCSVVAGFLEAESPGIHSLDTPDPTPVHVVLDSGAAVHVLNSFEAPYDSIVESPGSKAGACFAAAN